MAQNGIEALHTATEEEVCPDVHREPAEDILMSLVTVQRNVWDVQVVVSGVTRGMSVSTAIRCG